MSLPDYFEKSSPAVVIGSLQHLQLQRCSVGDFVTGQL